MICANEKIEICKIEYFVDKISAYISKLMGNINNDN